jgi:hypothetical protein
LGVTLLIRAWSNQALAPRGWPAALLPFAPSVLALGLVWDGTLSGGALPGVAERVSLSLLDLAVKPHSPFPDANLAASEGMLWGAFALALALGMGLGRNVARLDALSARFPRLAKGLQHGLGADALGEALVRAGTWVGRLATQLADDTAWNAWMPNGLDRAIRGTSALVSKLDARIAWSIGGALRPGVEWPARALQWVQSGDVQWYIGVALVSLLAVVAAFIRSP